MEEEIDDICRLFGILSIDVNRRHTLKEILNLVGSVRKETLQRVEVEIQLPRLFDCLNTSDEEEIKLSCAILDKILPDMNPEIVFTRCLPCLQRAQNHPMNEVRSIVLKVLLKAVEFESLLPVICEQGLLANSVTCLFTNDLHLTKLASEFIIKMSKNPMTMKTVLSGQPLSYMQTSKAMNSEFSFRVYEVIVGIALTSEEGFVECVMCGLLPELITEVKQEDPLMQLNALDLIGKLAETSYGFKYLETEGVIIYICSKFTQMYTDPSLSLLLPGYIKFCGTLAHAHPIEMATLHPDIIHFMVGTIVTDATDPVSLIVLLETLAYIASSPEGKKILHSLGDAIPRLMANFEEYMRYLPSELKERAMSAFGGILRLQPEEQTEELLHVTNHWFSRIHATPLDLIIAYCYQPFPDVQLAGLKLIQVIAEQPWGVQEINKQIGLIEFLLDRKRASSKESREIKYEIIRSLLHSHIAESVFSPNILSQMREYVNRGPFYIEASTEVAVEEKAN
ncbi:26S proteasome non-ATPase regulatory subunit 5-like [Schistocerca serialis cubense]|uniref:26S proteasome non-ATPase regulatory subunit 5-like n=1 Tax=Schistocerca serialis cubense TaxID=2023355 RepID=UPI00214EB919|nr:26S proteasome non-ATPase regulatory subunit 5-like [Schistocerca serialis cubense]